MTFDEIRKDLKEIRYYYSRKDVFENAENTIGGNCILRKIDKYNDVVKQAPPKLYDIYNGLYHNKLFKRICETHGLNAEEEGGKGYAKTSLTLDSGHLLKEYTDKNPPEFIYRIAEKKGLPVRINNVRKYFCPVCGSKVKATRSVNIICADCGVAFNEEIIEI